MIDVTSLTELKRTWAKIRGKYDREKAPKFEPQRWTGSHSEPKPLPSRQVYALTKAWYTRKIEQRKRERSREQYYYRERKKGLKLAMVRNKQIQKWKRGYEAWEKHKENCNNSPDWEH